MINTLSAAADAENRRGHVTLAEIRQQPDLWETTLAGIKNRALHPSFQGRTAIVCGAGTSAYAASAVAGAWARAVAIPTTDLLLYSKREILQIVPDFAIDGLLVSLARSGDSPESTGVVERFARLFPDAKQLAITCNERGRLAQFSGVDAIVLDPRTNDRSLVMTSSFSNLVLAGLALVQETTLIEWLPRICERVKTSLATIEALAKRLAVEAPDRFVVLASADLLPLAREACLKVLEMTAGRVVSLAETFLGLRHGPMSFVRPDSLVLCVLSNDKHKRRYEEDLLRELRHKKLGRLLVVGRPDDSSIAAQVSIPAMAPELPDDLRTPFEIVFPQLLAYHLSLAANLDPDSPSPDGVITRVVEEFQVHDGT